MRYISLLLKLKHSFRQTLRTQKEYEESIRENEDGFFLQLYRRICEGQMFMSAHLHRYFERQRKHTSEIWGGYSKIPHQVVVNLHCAQNEVINTGSSMMYKMAFEMFPFEESVFRSKVEKELNQVKIFKSLSESPYQSDARLVERMKTQFVKVYLDLEAQRARAMLGGNGVVTEAMVEMYLSYYESLR